MRSLSLTWTVNSISLSLVLKWWHSARLISGNPSCTTLVYEEDPNHTGPRGLLLVVHNEALTWLVMLT